ncbi:MAG: tetratricopeptide repeat protein [Alphaproteobacteria bacterium]
MPLSTDWATRVLRRVVVMLIIAGLPAACSGLGRKHARSHKSAKIETRAPAPQDTAAGKTVVVPTVDAPKTEARAETASEPEVKALPEVEPPSKPENDVKIAAAVRDGSPTGDYLAGRHAQTQRDISAAAKYYSRALEDDANNVELMRHAYALLAAEGDIDRAVAIVQRLMAAKHDSPMAPLVVAVRDARSGDFAAAEKVLAPVPRHGINSFLAPLMIAWAQVGQKRVDDALKTLDSLARVDHLKALYNYHAGLINDLADRREAAGGHYQAMLEAEGGLSLRAVEVVGSFHLRQGMPDKARALVRRYQSDHPESVLLEGLVRGLDGGPAGARPVGAARDGIAESLFGAATSVREGNALDSSLLFARLALAVEPDFPLAQVLVGDILQSQSRYADANGAYQAIRSDSPVYFSARLRIADNLKRMKRLDEATTILRDLAEKNPDRPEALIDLGDFLRGDKRYVEAAEAYDRALARVRAVEPRHWALFYSRGIALERAKQWARAERDFLKALELEPEQPYVLNYLGYSWLEQGINLEKARGMIRRAVELRPEDGYIVDSLGWSEYMAGEFESAVRDIERAVELQPEDPVINDHLGDAYWRVGRRTEARYQWKRSLGLDPEPDQVEGIRKKLEQGLSSPPSTAVPAPSEG